MQTDILKEKKRIVREEFLSKFFLPLRRQYEENIGKYQSLFPIKETDLAKESA